MRYANVTAGTATPAPGHVPAQLISAIDHLRLAARLIDLQANSSPLRDLDEDVRTSLRDTMMDIHGELFDQYGSLCEVLYEILHATGVAGDAGDVQLEDLEEE